MKRTKDQLSILKEAYSQKYIKEAVSVESEKKTVSGLINDIKNMLIDHPHADMYVNDLQSIENEFKNASEYEVVVSLKNRLRELFPKIKSSRKVYSQVAAHDVKRNYNQTFRGLADRGKHKPAPKLSGIEKLAAKIASANSEPISQPEVAPSSQEPVKKSVDLNSLQQFLDINKGDLSEEGYRLATDAINKAKETGTQDDIDVAKQLVDQAANGDI